MTTLFTGHSAEVEAQAARDAAMSDPQHRAQVFATGARLSAMDIQTFEVFSDPTNLLNEMFGDTGPKSGEDYRAYVIERLEKALAVARRV